MKVLVTGGGTREPIDGVRFITNFSTGETAAIVVDGLARAGHEVTALFGMGAAKPARAARVFEYLGFADLDAKIRDLVSPRGPGSKGSFGAVIHMAAVSDYSVAAIESGGKTIAPGSAGKLSSGEEVILRLKPNFKIVDRIKSYGGDKGLILVAFKLTNTPSAEERMAAVRKLARSGEADFIVHNDLGDRQRGAPAFQLFRNGKQGAALEPLRTFRSREELAQGLAGLLEKPSLRSESK